MEKQVFSGHFPVQKSDIKEHTPFGSPILSRMRKII
jgi:hypothetical protein